MIGQFELSEFVNRPSISKVTPSDPTISWYLFVSEDTSEIFSYPQIKIFIGWLPIAFPELIATKNFEVIGIPS